MPKATLAQIGEGDPKVLAHPGYREFPPSKITLKTEKAQREYEAIGRLLWNAGRLSQATHLDLSAWAGFLDQIEQIETEGRTPRASWFTGLVKAQARLKLDDLDKPISAPKSAPINPYSRFGFARDR